jgi:hypothetical protein
MPEGSIVTPRSPMTATMLGRTLLNPTDMGIPNSAYGRPERSYFENALTLVAADDTPAAYAPFLIRYGVTDDVEFLGVGDGLISPFGDQPTTGFSSLALDLKAFTCGTTGKVADPASSPASIYNRMGLTGFPEDTNVGQSERTCQSHETNLNDVGTGVQNDRCDIGSAFVPRHNFLIPGLQSGRLNTTQVSFQWVVDTISPNFGSS